MTRIHNMTMQAVLMGVMVAMAAGTVHAQGAEGQDEPMAMITLEGDLNGDGVADKAVRAEGTDAWAITYGARTDSDGVVRMDVHVLRDGRLDFQPGEGQIEVITANTIVWARSNWDFVIAVNSGGTYAIYNDGRVIQRTQAGFEPVLFEARDTLLTSLGIGANLSPYTQSDVNGGLFEHFQRLQTPSS